MTLTKVSVPTDTWLSDLSLSKDGATSSKGSIALDQTFQPSVHAYTAVVPDTPPAVYLWIDGDIETAATTFTARYRTITSTSLDDQEKGDPHFRKSACVAGLHAAAADEPEWARQYAHDPLPACR